MSTRATCVFPQHDDGRWSYKLQRYPYGDTQDYDEEGPFPGPTREAANKHLARNHANPGGASISWNKKFGETCEHDSACVFTDLEGLRRCEACGKQLPPNPAIEDARRQTGRTTGRILEAVAAAIRTPGLRVQVIDHRPMDKVSTDMIADKARVLIERLQLHGFSIHRAVNQVWVQMDHTWRPGKA